MNAGQVEAGPEEISALLHTRDTSTRLSWVDAKITYIIHIDVRFGIIDYKLILVEYPSLLCFL